MWLTGLKNGLWTPSVLYRTFKDFTRNQQFDLPGGKKKNELMDPNTSPLENKNNEGTVLLVTRLPGISFNGECNGVSTDNLLQVDWLHLFYNCVMGV